MRTIRELGPFDPFELLSTMRPGRIEDLDDMRILPGIGDIPGPLWWSLEGQFRTAETPVRVFDMCDDAAAYEAMTGEPHRSGAPMHADRFMFVLEHRSGLDCSAHSGENQVGRRYAVRNYLDDLSLKFFGSPSEARREGERLAEQQRLHLEKRRVSDVASGGYHTPKRLADDSDPYPAIEFPPVDRQRDRVEVIPESIVARDGVLRGLVRNWSRELWAYGVTVAAGDSVWRWPLSLQPGETAPFELAGWSGSDDGAEIEFRIDAEMSLEVDLSRAFSVWAADNPNTYTVWVHGLPTSALALFPDADDFDPAVDHFNHWYGVGQASSWINNPYAFGNVTSYRSLADVVDYFTIPNVVVYVASMDERQQVVRLARVPLLSWPPYDDTEAWEEDRLVEIRRFPPFDRSDSTYNEATFVYYIPDRSWTHRIWIGGTHAADA
ncbi:MAG: hypothetical protein OXF65_07760 [Acidimicrobiaceae bacterium]|nr:hypothetical protein [Acidimicrobiaceae bacterium]